MDLPDPLTGDELERRLKEKIIHIPFAEGFLYKNASLMISSQPGIGKSLLSIQAAYELSLGMPLFGALGVPHPIRVWYIQMERPDIESLERLQSMRGDATAPLTNLFLDCELQALNFLNPEHFKAILNRGRSIRPDLIIIDPLYGIATGLSKDEVGSSVAKLLTILKKTLGCALWINHHTTKFLYEIIDGKKISKDDPFYGAQWLKAHVTGSYFSEQFDGGLKLTCKKDSHSILLKEIVTSFDHDTYLSNVKVENMIIWDRYKLFLTSVKLSGRKTYTFDEARANLGCTLTPLRELHRTPLFNTYVKVLKNKGSKTLYEVI
jgi:hypothetical protein